MITWHDAHNSGLEAKKKMKAIFGFEYEYQHNTSLFIRARILVHNYCSSNCVFWNLIGVTNHSQTMPNLLIMFAILVRAGPCFVYQSVCMYIWFCWGRSRIFIGGGGGGEGAKDYVGACTSWARQSPNSNRSTQNAIAKLSFWQMWF